MAYDISFRLTSSDDIHPLRFMGTRYIEHGGWRSVSSLIKETSLKAMRKKYKKFLKNSSEQEIREALGDYVVVRKNKASFSRELLEAAGARKLKRGKLTIPRKLFNALKPRYYNTVSKSKAVGKTFVFDVNSQELYIKSKSKKKHVCSFLVL